MQLSRSELAETIASGLESESYAFDFLPPLLPAPASDSVEDRDRFWLTKALHKAKNAISTAVTDETEFSRLSEVPIAAILVKDSTQEELDWSFNATNRERDATRHAEIIIIENLCSRGITNFDGCTLYVTVEPCIMCASALALTGIKRVIYGAPNDKFGGCGSVLNVPELMSAPISASCCYFRAEAVELLRHFYVRGNAFAPTPHRAAGREAANSMLETTTK